MRNYVDYFGKEKSVSYGGKRENARSSYWFFKAAKNSIQNKIISDLFRNDPADEHALHCKQYELTFDSAFDKLKAIVCSLLQSWQTSSSMPEDRDKITTQTHTKQIELIESSGMAGIRSGCTRSAFPARLHIGECIERLSTLRERRDSQAERLSRKEAALFLSRETEKFN